MITATACRTLIDYHYTLYERVWESIMHLSEEQFIAPAAYAHGSVNAQMVHVALVDQGWTYDLQGDPHAPPFDPNPDDYITRAQTRALWDETVQTVQTYVHQLTDEALTQNAPDMPGPRWQALVHLVNHGTDHRAQILRLLHDLGAPTFSQDLIFHLWEL